MAQQIITNPSITPGALKIELSGDYVTAISGHPIGGTGGSSPSVVYSGVVGEIIVDNQQGSIGIDDVIKNNINSKASKVELNTTYNTLNEAKQDKLTFGYDDSAISSINGSAIAGAGAAGEYSAGVDLKIENNIISVDTNGNPNNTANNTRNFVEGSWTVASGYMNHAEGVATSALGYGVHAQGMWTKFSSSKWSDTEHPEPVDIYWAAGAGATVEGYCNATTSCPMSGTEEQGNYGPIHGGIIKVIGNGYREHKSETEPATYNPSDALIIYRDGCISAAGNISANGIELGQGGGTTYQGRNGVNVDGGYIELTQTAYEAVTSIAGLSTDVGTLKVASADWDEVSAKLDSIIAAQTYLKISAYDADSGKFALKTQLEDYYKKTDTSSKTELSTEFAKYQVTGDYATAADLNTVSSSLTGVDDALSGYIDCVSGEVDNKVNKPTSVQTGKLVYDGDTSAWVSMPAGTTTIVQGENSISAEYDSGNSTYTVGLKPSAESALSSVANKLTKPATAVNTYYVWDAEKEEWIDAYDLTGKVYTQPLETDVTPEQGKYYGMTYGSEWSEIPLPDLDDYVPFTADDLAIGTEVDASGYAFAQGAYTSAYRNSYAFGTNTYAWNRSLGAGERVVASGHSLGVGGFGSGTGVSANDCSLAVGNLVSANSGGVAVGAGVIAEREAIAVGKNCKASDYSIAVGINNSAYGEFYVGGGVAIGESLEISGGMALGCFNATKSAAFVIGDGDDIGGTENRSDSFVIYRNGSVSAKGDISANGVKLGPGGGGSLTLPVNVGTGNDVSQTSAIGAIGNNCSAGTKSFAFSYKGATAYENSFAVNDDNIAGHNSFAWGWGTTADNYSMAGGNNASADNHSFALAQGDSTAKSRANNYSIAFGNAVSANRWSYVFGRGLNFSGSDNETTGIGALVVGGWNYTTAGAIFVLGNGTGDGDKKDAMVVYRNGSINIGNNTVNGSNFYVEGLNNLATSAGATSLGHGYTHIEGGFNTSNGGLYNHIEGEANTAYGDRIHIEGNRNIYSAGSYEWGVSVEGMANATTANVAAHDGILKVIGNGTRQKSGDTEIITRSDAYILYRDGTVSAKQFQNADGTDTINGTTYSFTGVDNIEILPNAATANTANFPNDNVLRFILES